MADEAIIAVVRGYLRALRERGVDAAFAVLYGSHARGTADRWSDIDLVVVAPQFDRLRAFDDDLPLWRVAAKFDTRIEPIACGVREWEEDDSRVILEIARREGIVIAPGEAPPVESAVHQ